MCGIAGIARFDRAPIERSMLQRMADALRHRGPDGEGIYMNGRVGFAHRRLAIIDPAGGRQPFVDEASGLALTYNGEVYNYKEIRQDLVDRHRLRTESDTEVVLAAYRERGIDCLSSFRGMFAFALHDRQQNRLFLVRDRIGVKPLYYSVTPERIVFASELNALLQSGCVPTGLEAGAIASYFRYGYVPTPRSIYADVKKLLPAHYLLVDLNSGQTRLQRYWTLSPDISCVSEAEALDRLNTILADAVRLSLRSDVPFGSFLSGGVDSSIVSALMTNELTEPVHTFSIGFREEQTFRAAAMRVWRRNGYRATIQKPSCRPECCRAFSHLLPVSSANRSAILPRYRPTMYPRRPQPKYEWSSQETEGTSFLRGTTVTPSHI